VNVFSATVTKRPGAHRATVTKGRARIASLWARIAPGVQRYAGRGRGGGALIGAPGEFSGDDGPLRAAVSERDAKAWRAESGPCWARVEQC